MSSKETDDVLGVFLTPGWEWIEDRLKQQIDAADAAIWHVKDMAELGRIRGLKEAYTFVLGIPEQIRHQVDEPVSGDDEQTP